MVIYADILFIVNLIADYMLLLGVCAVNHIKPKGIRLIFGAVIGALGSFSLMLPRLNFFLSLIIKIALCLLMSVSTFPIKSIRSVLRYASWILGLTFAYCGIMTLIVQIFAPKTLMINNMSVYVDISPLLLIISTTVCYFTIKVIMLVGAKIKPKECCYEIEIFNQNKSIACRALLDTGCNLHDLYSGSPVIVLEKQLAMSLVPKQIDLGVLIGDNSKTYDNAADMNGFKLIPYSAIGGKGLMRAFIADRAVISQKNKKSEVKRVTVAISDELLSGEYRALIGEDILQ